MPRTGSKSIYPSANNSSNPPANYGFPNSCPPQSVLSTITLAYFVYPLLLCPHLRVAASLVACEPNRPHSCANRPPLRFFPVASRQVLSPPPTRQCPPPGPPKIPAPTAAYTIPSTTHVTYSSMPSSYSLPAVPIRNYPYTSSTPQRTSPCNPAASPVRPAYPSIVPPRGTFPYVVPQPDGVRPRDKYDIRPPPPSLRSPPPLLNAGVDAASLHPPQPRDALAPRPQLPIQPSIHPLLNPGSAASASEKPPLSFPGPPTPETRHTVAAARRRRKKATTAKMIALAETARLFSRETQRSLQKQNSEHVSTSRLLAAQLASESGKRAASQAKVAPTPPPAVRFRHQ